MARAEQAFKGTHTHARTHTHTPTPEGVVEINTRTHTHTPTPEGVVEIWLTSEDLGAYGHDIGVTLPELLWKLVAVVPEGCMIRLGMTNPPYIMEHVEVSYRLLMLNKIISKHFHVFMLVTNIVYTF